MIGHYLDMEYTDQDLVVLLSHQQQQQQQQVSNQHTIAEKKLDGEDKSELSNSQISTKDLGIVSVRSSANEIMQHTKRMQNAGQSVAIINPLRRDSSVACAIQ